MDAGSGFEPLTLSLWDSRADQTALSCNKNGASEEFRNPTCWVEANRAAFALLMREMVDCARLELDSIDYESIASTAKLHNPWNGGDIQIRTEYVRL